jgi:predicted  nucleic acid-binding Zn-ribbon protein
MDENVILQTLNSTLQRHAKQIATYEIEIANLTAESFRIQSEFDAMKMKKEELEVRLANMLENTVDDES